MSIKRNLMSIAIGFILLVFINILLFPIAKTDLQNEVESEEISTYENEELPGSILYLVKTTDEKHYLIHAEKALFFSRYRLLKPMTLFEEQEFSISNITHDILVTFDGNSMKVEWQKNIIGNLWPLLFIGFVFLANFTASIIHKVRQIWSKV